MVHFVSSAQRKAVMARLKDAGVRQRPLKITEEGNHFRIRVVNPKMFQGNTFRTIDVGKPGGLKAIIARPKGKNTTATQAFLLEKK